MHLWAMLIMVMIEETENLHTNVTSQYIWKLDDEQDTTKLQVLEFQRYPEDFFIYYMILTCTYVNMYVIFTLMY